MIPKSFSLPLKQKNTDNISLNRDERDAARLSRCCAVLAIWTLVPPWRSINADLPSHHHHSRHHKKPSAGTVTITVINIIILVMVIIITTITATLTIIRTHHLARSPSLSTSSSWSSPSPPPPLSPSQGAISADQSCGIWKSASWEKSKNRKKSEKSDLISY